MKKDDHKHDRQLWHQVAATVKPLKGRKAIAAPAKSAAPDQIGEGHAAPAAYTPKAPVHPSQLEQLNLSSGNNLDANTLKRLRSGQLPVAGRIDLHGMTQEQAHTALKRFIHFGYHNGRRCVLVITGRSGILRDQTPRWLNEYELRPYIIAMAPAQPGHGGPGAIYVLLKRRREG